ncbi:hypothetical protein M408DRAFT_29562 [Serendipita vermifera MAFF 305830]|uniref:Ubiquitin-like domain-containing protein n=1 Tax=Serendipita vermifera MAFF 305830 TaxID=933852 RepID=A0A0C2W4M1_SERVB|nr:hypothetical protein M408DRAFT_29562 [Serendipita vermifera MAFF 305830]
MSFQYLSVGYVALNEHNWSTVIPTIHTIFITTQPLPAASGSSTPQGPDSRRLSPMPFDHPMLSHMPTMRSQSAESDNVLPLTPLDLRPDAKITLSRPRTAATTPVTENPPTLLSEPTITAPIEQAPTAPAVPLTPEQQPGPPARNLPLTINTSPDKGVLPPFSPVFPMRSPLGAKPLPTPPSRAPAPPAAHQPHPLSNQPLPPLPQQSPPLTIHQHVVTPAHQRTPFASSNQAVVPIVHHNQPVASTSYRQPTPAHQRTASASSYQPVASTSYRQSPPEHIPILQPTPISPGLLSATSPMSSGFPTATSPSLLSPSPDPNRISVFICQSDGFVVPVTSPEYRIVSLSRTSTIADLKDAVADEYVIPPYLQELSVNGRILDDEIEEHLLETAGVGHGTVLVLRRGQSARA